MKRILLSIAVAAAGFSAATAHALPPWYGENAEYPRNIQNYEGVSASGAGVGAGVSRDTGRGSMNRSHDGSMSPGSSSMGGASATGSASMGGTAPTTGTPLPNTNYQPGATTSNPGALNSGPTGR